jgi:hypothetical protein
MGKKRHPVGMAAFLGEPILGIHDWLLLVETRQLATILPNLARGISTLVRGG